jgi:nucleoside-diphosphate-sugar epimerase
MRVLLVGASGFIGQSIAANMPDGVQLTGTYFQNRLTFENTNSEQFNFLNPDVEWQRIVEQYDCVIIAARVNADNETKRADISRKAKDAFKCFIQAVDESTSKPFIVAVNGSLSYGHRNDDLVKIGDSIAPTGYARSYAIAEQPFREFLAAGNEIAIVRAPWVLGPGSWFPMMYLEPNRVPLIGDGKQWMSLVLVDDLAKYLWDTVTSLKKGIHHPRLTYRCRQKEFATLVHDITSQPIRRLGRIQRLRMDPQMRESIHASIKLDDGRGDGSEHQDGKKRLISAIETIYASFS